MLKIVLCAKSIGKFVGRQKKEGLTTMAIT